MTYRKFTETGTKLFTVKTDNREYYFSRTCGIIKTFEYRLSEAERNTVKFLILLALVGFCALIRFSEYYIGNELYVLCFSHIAAVIALLSFSLLVLHMTRKKFERENPEKVKYYMVDWVPSEEGDCVLECIFEVYLKEKTKEE